MKLSQMRREVLMVEKRNIGWLFGMTCINKLVTIIRLILKDCMSIIAKCQLQVGIIELSLNPRKRKMLIAGARGRRETWHKRRNGFLVTCINEKCYYS